MMARWNNLYGPVLTLRNGSNGETHTDVKHVLERLTLQPPYQHDKTDYGKRIYRKLPAQPIHRPLQRRLRRLLLHHHFEHGAELAVLARTHHYALKHRGHFVDNLTLRYTVRKSYQL